MSYPHFVALLLILALPLSAAFPILPAKEGGHVFSLVQQPSSPNPFMTLFPISQSPSPYVLYPSNDSIWIDAVSTSSSSVSSQILQFFLNGTVKNRVPSLPNVFVSSIIVDPVLRRAWFPENNTLAYYDPRTMQLGNATTFANESPQYVALDSSDKLWLSLVGPGGQSRIAVYNPLDPQSKPTLYPVPTPNATVQGIAVAPDGTIWFAETVAKKLARLDPNTSIITEYSSPITLVAPIQVAVDSSGIVWFTDHGDNEFGWFNPQTKEWKTLPIGYCPSSCVYGLPNAIFIYKGEIWFSEHIAGRIAKYNPNTKLLTEYIIPSSSSPLAWWARPGPNNLVWFTALGLGEIGYVNASIPVPFSISAPSTDVAIQRGSSVKIPTRATSQGVAMLSFGISPVTQDQPVQFTAQIYGSSPSNLTLNNNSQTAGFSVSAAWNATLGPRYVALTASDGQVAVNAHLRIVVVESSAPFVALGFSTMIALGGVTFYLRRPRKPKIQPVKKTRR